MEKATSLGETEDPTNTNRWNEARHTDDRFVVGQADDLEAMQSLECLDGGRALHPDARRQSDEVDFSPTGTLFHDSPAPASQKRRCRTDELRRHLFDVSIAQSPSIIGVGRDRNQVQNRLLRKAIHDPVKAPNQLIRDGETASALLDSRPSGRICRQRPSRASGRRPRSEAGPRVPARALRARPFASPARASAGSRTGLTPLRRRDYRALHKGRSVVADPSNAARYRSDLSGASDRQSGPPPRSATEWCFAAWPALDFGAVDDEDRVRVVGLNPEFLAP